MRPSRVVGQDVVINEFLAADSSGISNALGQADDWIELYNTTDAAIELAGWHLTDNRDNLTNPFMRQLQLAVDGVAARSAFVRLYINGQYWGLYNPVERPDQAFAESYYDEPKTLCAAVNSGTATGESVLDTWTAMQAAANSLQLNSPYQVLQGNDPDGQRNTNRVVHLDVRSHADYMAVQIWGGTIDWPHRNWFANAACTNSTGWRFFVWDQEGSLSYTGSVNKDITNTTGPTGLFGKLRANPDFRMLFADRVRRSFFDNGALTAASLQTRYQALVDAVRPGILANAARWGTLGTVNDWENGQT